MNVELTTAELDLIVAALSIYTDGSAEDAAEVRDLLNRLTAE